ncbi:MAG TPA: hypothetical protein VNA24_03340 [Hyalangium sp.]|nr:hypothetical protein [Hyalangium sp.]
MYQLLPVLPSWLSQRVLKVASRLLVHSRRVTLVIGQQAAGYWRALWHTLRSFDTAHVT